jgi:hypothetical protein
MILSPFTAVPENGLASMPAQLQRSGRLDALDVGRAILELRIFSNGSFCR